ncbi:MAG TPA: sigma-70 family RNA polymerase sigma factor [Planctomycetota bacterium]
MIVQLHAGKPNDSWNWFIRRYRGYVTAVLRHVGFRSEEAVAATEEFWSYLFSSRAVERADRSGRFRSFLSGIVRNYAKTWRREHASKQAIRATDSTLDAFPDLHAEVDIELWAAQILHLGLTRLARSYPDDERVLRWFYGLPGEVGGDPQPPLSATEIAKRLGCTPNAMHQTLFRARHRLRECIEKEIAATIGSSPDLLDELVLLLGAVDRARPGLIDLNGSPP